MDAKARVSMFIEAPAEEIYDAFVEPGQLAKFWLAKSDGPLAIGRTVHWHFMVEGAEVDTVATSMERGKGLAWRWSDKTNVQIDFEPVDGGTAVTLVNDGFPKEGQELIDAALNATEGFAIVLCDLKTLLESGTSAGITSAKAKLIQLRG
jgi:uncharacterized protein YndB with AHSA1/START domain